jgi:hypothetical protein
MSDTINRVPPPIPPRDPLRSVGAGTAPIIKREDRQPQKNKKNPRATHDDEPQDTVELSTTVPEVETHGDGQDQFWITLAAAQDLLTQHQHVYSPVDYQQLLGHLIHLKKVGIEKIYWPPTITFADAMTQAANADMSPDH